VRLKLKKSVEKKKKKKCLFGKKIKSVFKVHKAKKLLKCTFGKSLKMKLLLKNDFLLKSSIS
jgi:hypothetical protein